MQVHARRLGSEGGVGGAGPNQLKMSSTPGSLMCFLFIGILGTSSDHIYQ